MAKRTIEADVDGLFRLPLGEFTAARNALAARLKKDGRKEEADDVKALPKPSVPAWTVNQLFWQHRDAFDRLLDTGAQFRKAQVAQIGGKPADIRGLLDARREALSELSRHAAELLRGAGSPASPDMMRRITTTLEALATYSGLPDAPRAGRLTDDIEPPGFEALAALVPRVSGRTKSTDEPIRVLPFQSKRPRKEKLDPAAEAKRLEEERRAAQAAARDALAAAERALRDARRDAERAEAALKKAATRAKEAARAKEELEQRYEKLVAASAEATAEYRRIAEEAESAAQSVTDAERDLETARRAAEALE